MKWLLTIGLTLTLALAAAAQPPSDDSGSQGRHGQSQHQPPSDADFLKMLTHRLSLSPDQQSQVEQLLKSMQRGKARHEAIAALLTAEQKSKFDAMRPPGRNQGQGDQPRPAPKDEE